jgi:hypothetical protein
VRETIHGLRPGENCTSSAADEVSDGRSLLDASGRGPARAWMIVRLAVSLA